LSDSFYIFFIMSFFLDKKRNKKIKAAYDFGNDYGSFRYALGNIWTYKIALLFY